MKQPTLVALVALCLVEAVLPACGGSGNQITCTPACGSGYRCTPEGCVPDGDGGGPAPDLAASADAGCACSGATPVCNAGGVCVACVADGDCPVGSSCKVISPVQSACLPGCKDDGRCGGGAMRCCDAACTNTGSDARNCGACGTVCAPEHAAGTCRDGACVTGACVDGWGDCDGNGANGCETNLTADLRNCGGCANVCPSVPHAKSACGAGRCLVTACDVGYADCDGNPVNGCEATLATDSKNCGACGSPCGVGQVCKNGSCTCAQCNIPNARTKCVNLVCVLDSCLPGWENCNALPQDGCEVDTTSDARNCGACGKVCPNNAPFCQGSVCSNITASCADALRANPNAPSGLYTIDPDGNGGNPSYQVYCEMVLDGGGWTVFFAGINGSPNLFDHFEDSALNCADPAARCMRRLPPSVTLNTQFLVSCGNAALRFNANQQTLNYFQAGTQGGSWMNNLNVAVASGNSDAAYGGQTWTGQVANKGWIISAGDRMQPRTFASSYNVNAQWDYCNGVPDVVSPVRLYYR